MKIEGLDGEWELYTGDITLNDRNDNLRVLRRIPEKSELRSCLCSCGKSRYENEMHKWVSQLNKGRGEYAIGYSAGLWDGFRKAIQVLKQSDHDCAYNTIDILKAYCGDK